MTKKPFHSMSDDFDELDMGGVTFGPRVPTSGRVPDNWKPPAEDIEKLQAYLNPPQASKPRDKSAGEIHMSWLNENSHSKPERAIERSAFRELKAEADKLAEALERISNFSVTADHGRFGAFIGAGAVDIAIVALTNWQRYLEGEG